MLTSVNAANAAYAGGINTANTPAANKAALQAAYGIYRSNPSTIVQLAAADGHHGLTGTRNF